jgi:integrase/recombinase XerD
MHRICLYVQDLLHASISGQNDNFYETKVLFCYIVKNITNYLTKDEVDLLLNSARVCNHRDYLILRVLWRTGVRVSELLHIRPRDIEFYNHVINITRAKGGKQRRVLLDDETTKMLSNYVLSQKLRDDEPIFGVQRVQVFRIVKKYGTMLGLDVHPHTLRHSYAIHLVRNGMDLRRVQLLMGHSSLNTTQIYLQFKDQDLREVYDKIEF